MVFLVKKAVAIYNVNQFLLCMYMYTYIICSFANSMRGFFVFVSHLTKLPIINIMPLAKWSEFAPTQSPSETTLTAGYTRRLYLSGSMIIKIANILITYTKTFFNSIRIVYLIMAL